MNYIPLQLFQLAFSKRHFTSRVSQSKYALLTDTHLIQVKLVPLETSAVEGCGGSLKNVYPSLS